MSKKTTTKITKTEWSRFIASVIRDELKRYGLDGIDNEFDNWDWEEHEDAAGTYFVNYYASSEEDFDQFEKRLGEIVARRGWKVETCAPYGEFEEERSGEHFGRRLCYFYITK